MGVLLQVSDTHFGTERVPVVQALQVLTHQQGPDVMVLSGDITQRARPAQFRAARAFADSLGVTTLAVPGNHDLPLFNAWGRFGRPYAHYKAAFGEDLEPVFQTKDLLVVGVNTTRVWRHQHGEVSDQQVERVARLLSGAQAAQLRVVVVHQPMAVTRLEDTRHCVRGHEMALPRWAAAGADMVMGGHIHLPYVKLLPQLQRPLWVVQAGTAVSSRTRAGVPNSVNLLRWGKGVPPGCCLVEQWDYLAHEGAFVQVKVTHVWPARG